MKLTKIILKFRNETKDILNATKSPNKNKFIFDSFYSMAAFVSKVFLAFISIPLCLNYLGKEKFGLWMFVLSIVSFVQFFDIGITPTLKNKLIEKYSLKLDEEFAFYFRVGLLFSTFLVIFSLFIVLIIPFINWRSVLSISSIPNQELTSLIMVVFLVSSGYLILLNVENYYAATLQLGKIKKYDFFVVIISIVILYFAISLNFNLALIAFIYSGQLVVVRFIFLIKLFRERKNLFLEISKISPIIKKLKSVVIFSLPFMGIKLCEFLLTIIPNIFIAKFKSYEILAEFNSVFKFISIPMFLMTSILPIIWPIFSLKWFNQEIFFLNKIIKYSLSFIIVGYIIFLCMGYVWGAKIIYIWTSGKITVNSNYIVSLILLCFTMSLTYIVSTFLHSVSDFKFELVCHIGIVIMYFFAFGLLFYTNQIGFSFLGMSIAWFVCGFLPMILRTKYFLRLKPVTNE